MLQLLAVISTRIGWRVPTRKPRMTTMPSGCGRRPPGWSRSTERFHCFEVARASEQSFGLQAKCNRRGRDLARCCLVVLEHLECLAERRGRDLSLTEHNPGAHKASPAVDVVRRTLQAACQAIHHRSDGSVALVRRRRLRP